MSRGTREVLQAMGIAPLRTRKVAHRYTNDHWKVATVDGDVFLRRSVSRSTDAVAYEVTVLEGLARRGWPVPRPIAGPVTVRGSVWAAFEARGGRPRRPRSEPGHRAEQRERGRLLGQLHVDLAAMGQLQKPGFQRAERSFDGLEHQLLRLSRTRPDEARELARHAEQTQLALEALHAEAAPVQIIHGDFSAWNLLFTRQELSGVLDFDLSHLNHRVADFAISWRGVHHEVVRGYYDVNPLEPSDRDLLVPFFRAWYLFQASTKFVGSVIPDAQLGFVLHHLNTKPELPG